MTEPIVPQAPRTVQECVNALYDNVVPPGLPDYLQALAVAFIAAGDAIWPAYEARRAAYQDDAEAEDAEAALQAAAANRDAAEEAFRTACAAWLEGQGR